MCMSVRIYLLSLREISGPEQTKDFVRQAVLLVDEVRREKAEKIQKPGAQAVSLGAGLLLQKMVMDYQDGAADCEEQDCEEQDCEEQNCEVLHYEARELLELLKTGQQNVSERIQDSQRIPLPLQYRFGPHGKPEIVDFPMYFSLSHSGDYVLCAVSDREVGADIQKLQAAGFSKLASRFFTEAEYQALEKCVDEAERQKLFFRLWTKKEAYGKLTGQGVAAILNRDVCFTPDIDINEKSSRSFLEGKTVSERGKQPKGLLPEWVEISAPKGYAVAMCTEANGPETNTVG